MRKFIVAVLLLSIVVSALPAFAQGDGDFSPEEEALLKNLNVAYEQLGALTAVETTSTQVLTQDLVLTSQPDTPIVTNLESVTSGVVTRNADGTESSDLVLEQTLLQTIAGLEQSALDMTMELRVVNDEYFVRVPVIEPFVPGFPADWVNLSEDPLAVPGMELTNFEQLSNFEGIIPTPEVADAAINSLTLLGEEDIDGTTYIVIEIDWDAFAVYTDEVFGVGQLLNLEALGVDGDEFLDAFLDGAVMTHRIWLDEATFAIPQIQVVLETDSLLPPSLSGGEEVRMVQRVEYTTTFTPLNSVPEIVAPDIN